jgi:hypothetical protein
MFFIKNVKKSLFDIIHMEPYCDGANNGQNQKILKNELLTIAFHSAINTPIRTWCMNIIRIPLSTFGNQLKNKCIDDWTTISNIIYM